MPAPVIGAIAAPVAGQVVGGLLGGRGKAQAQVPADMAPLRQQQISLLMNLIGGGGDPTKRLEGFFGPLTSDLQRTATNTIQQYATMQRPEQRTLEALQPLFMRNLAAANQSGGRFGSANALMRARAAEDFNVLGAQISGQAQDRQLGAAQLLAGLGQQNVAQRLALLTGLLGTAQGAAFNLPISQTQSGAQQGAALGGGIGQTLTALLPYLLPKKG